MWKISLALVLSASALACASASTATRPPSPASSSTVAQSSIRYLEITVPTHDDRNGQRSLALEARLEGDSWQWRARHRIDWWGDDRHAGSSSTRCGRPTQAPAVAPIVDALAAIQWSDHQRRGGSGGVRLSYRENGAEVHTNIQCELLASEGEGLCRIAQDLVGAYLTGLVLPPDSPANAESRPATPLEVLFAQRDAEVATQHCTL